LSFSPITPPPPKQLSCLIKPPPHHRGRTTSRLTPKTSLDSWPSPLHWAGALVASLYPRDLARTPGN
uniref:Uncharacterized protein n=1 Tax=Aegilops tauschii subsp. strangulata TaxID=200361 RepID=A0A453GNK2_AEGTS